MTTSKVRIVALLATVLGGVPGASFALSLGEARVLSALDAPLEAEIDVLDASAEEIAALSVEIPARDVFVRYGVARPAYLETARIVAGRGRDGRTVLQLRTRAKITDPFLTVLVVADWGRGRVLREFNLVIDRQVLAAQPTIAPAVATPRVDDDRAAPIERVEAPPTPKAPVSTSTDAGVEARVASGDTLLRFARETAKRSGVSLEQAAVALYEANPQAFGASMHDLRAGAVLRMPTAEELARVPRERAIAEYVRQNATWRNRGSVGDGAAAATVRNETTGRLRLVAPTIVDAPRADATRAESPPSTKIEPPVGASGAGGSGSRGESSNEARLAALERELAESTRLLELRSRELAALQNKIADNTPVSNTVDLSAALARLWWLWAGLIGLAVGLSFELVRRARLERERAIEVVAASAPGFAEPVAEPVVSMPVAVPAVAVPAVVVPAPLPVPPAPVPAPASVPAEASEFLEDFEGDPPPLDETGSRLDLARAYIEMGDPAAARAELEVVLRDGDAQQRMQAQRLIESLRR